MVIFNEGGGILTVDVSLPIAFGAGFLSFFSPCILPLIPAYIMYITGTSLETEVKKKRIFALIRTIGFILGFTAIFMMMGLSATFLGRLFVRNKVLFTRISGLLIIFFGLNMVGILDISFFKNSKNIKAPKITNWFSSFLMGMAFGAGWTPCFGPILGSILVFAGTSDVISGGTFLLCAYSLGMAIPFILTALFIDTFTNFMNKAQNTVFYITKIGGVVLVIFGLLLLLNRFSVVSNLFI